MTEQEWLASEDPRAMLALFAPRLVQADSVGSHEAAARFAVSDRKLRLFACACVRSVWATLDNYSRQLVRDVEEAANGERVDLSTRYRPDWPDCYLVGERTDWVAMQFAAGSRPPNEPDDVIPPPAVRAALLRDIVGNPFARPLVGGMRWNTNVAAAHVMRDLGWLTPTVRGLARAAYEARPGRDVLWCPTCGEVPYDDGTHDRCGGIREVRIDDGTLDPGCLAALSDAMEEAGVGEVKCKRCVRGFVNFSISNPQMCPECGGTGTVPHPILAHLRSEGPHYRGMWSLDVVLGLQ